MIAEPYFPPKKVTSWYALISSYLYISPDFDFPDKLLMLFRNGRFEVTLVWLNVFYSHLNLVRKIAFMVWYDSVSIVWLGFHRFPSHGTVQPPFDMIPSPWYDPIPMHLHGIIPFLCIVWVHFYCSIHRSWHVGQGNSGSLADWWSYGRKWST